MQPWVHQVQDDTAFWELCGFETPPSCWLVYTRFCELEQFADAFREAAGLVIRRARTVEPRIGRWLHVDATECETHGTPIHDCRDGDGCPSARRKRTRMKRLPSDTVAEIRHAQAELPEDDADGKVVINRAKPMDITEAQVDHQRRGVRFRSGGHWWFTRDPDAGTRAYTSGTNGRTKRAWHGYYNQKATCGFVRRPIAVHVHAADRSEHTTYPDLMGEAVENTGLVPVAVAGDRGYSIRSVYRWNTERGIGSVFPYRRENGHAPKRAVATDQFDEHGIPRCQHCGGLTRIVRFAHEPTPRLWFRCSWPSSAGCEREQSMSCSKDWRRLVPIPRTSELYAGIRHTHGSTENVHDIYRDQYRCGGKTLAERPKRIGLGVHNLRAQAALLIDWLRLSFRNGWLGENARRVVVRNVPAQRMVKAIQGRRIRIHQVARQKARARAGAPPPDPGPAPF